MYFISILLIYFINIVFSCNDLSKISFLPPFKTLTNIKLRLGESVTIICCHPNGAEYLKWYDGSSNEIKSNPNDGIFAIKDDKRRLILKIDKVKDSQYGAYTCQNNEKKISRVINVLQKEGFSIPKINKISNYFPKKTPITLKCPLKSSQTISYWSVSKGGTNSFYRKAGKFGEIYVSSNLANLTIKSNTEIYKKVWCFYEEVTYDGTVNNGMYEFSWKLYEPMNPRIEFENKGPILEGQDVTMICYFRTCPSSNPDCLSAIFIPQETLDTSGFNLGIIKNKIKKVTKDYEKIYRCQLTKFISTVPFETATEEAQIYLEVIVPPKIINSDFIMAQAKMNENAQLTCQIKGKPLNGAKSYYSKLLDSNNDTWLRLKDSDKYRTILKTDNDVYILILFIRDVQWNDRGHYKCVAENPAGTVEKIGKFKVIKRPELEIKNSRIYMAVKPIKVDCIVTGFPNENSRDKVKLKLLNNTNAIEIKKIKRKYDYFDGLTVTFLISHQNIVPEGTSYLFQCYYRNMQDNSNQTKNIILEIASKPREPLVYLICKGSSGFAFKLTIPESTNKNDRIEQGAIYYAPINEFDKLTKQPSLQFPILDLDRQIGSKFIVLRDVLPETVYKFKVEVQNIFRMSNYKILKGKTNNLAPPKTPKKLSFYPSTDKIMVNVTWESDCPYDGVNNNIENLLVRMKQQGAYKSDKNYNWEWTENKFKMEQNKNSLQFSIYLANAQEIYEVEVALRSLAGKSNFVKGIYRPEIVIPGSMFYCFPRCSACSWSNIIIVIQSVIIAFLIVLIQ